MDTQVKEKLDELGRTIESFKALNDERIAKGDKASGELKASVDKANADITKISDEIKALQTAIRAAETERARFAPAGSPEAAAKELIHARRFLNQMAKAKGERTVFESVNNDQLEGYRAYQRALNTYIRKGPDALDGTLRAALQTGQDASGGVFLTPYHSDKVIEFLRLGSPIRELASVETIGTDMWDDVVDLSESTSGGWVGETETRSETATPDAPFIYRIPVFEQFANPRSTQKMLDDADRDVEGWLAKKTADKMIRTENTTFVTGTGINKPKGFTMYSSGTPGATPDTFFRVQQINTGAAGAFAATNPVDKFIDIIHAIPSVLRAGAQFAMNNLTLAEVRKLKDGEGRYLLIPDISSEGVMNRLLGYGVVEFPDMADIAADSLSIAFAAWKSAYQIVDHTVGIRVLRDPYTAKPYVQFYTTKRVGGGLLDPQVIKLMKFAA